MASEKCTQINKLIKIRTQKNHHNAINSALTTLYFHSNKPNVAKFAHQRILRISNKITFSSTASQPASQPANRDRPSTCTTGYIAFRLSGNKRYFRQHEPLLFRSQYSLCAITCPSFIHSNRLILLLKTKVLTFHKDIDIQ